MDSVPPATIASAPPLMMRSAAIAIDCRPDEQKTIDGESRDFDGQSGTERGDAGHVHSLFGFGHGAAENDVFNFLGIKLRHAIERALDGDGG